MGRSAALEELRQEIDRVAGSEAKVLITGESGVGKELVAREIHSGSPRAARPFSAVNCAGLTETLLESELFGHVKGSFTGAYRDKPGKFEAANGGTVFLDEVGEMSLRMQGLLLRFLETGEIQKVGSDRTASPMNVRIIAATNRPLSGLITQGLFREDLFYRLNVIHLIVPPLRERREDIPVMVEYFRQRFARTNRSIVEAVAPEALAALTEYSWPGNVRQLENIIERMVVVHRKPVIEYADLPLELRAGPRPAGVPMPPLPKAVDVVEHLYSRLTDHRESFWTTVYPLYMQREITRTHVRELVEKGLSEARGNYKIMVQLFNMDIADYKKFLNFLRKHECQMPFKQYRQIINDRPILHA
jgi:transcriptional regulator with PAS, ATPase and Fis domain